MCLTCSQNNEDACMTGEDLNAGASSGRWDYKGNWMTGSNRVLCAISRILALIQVNKKKNLQHFEQILFVLKYC